MIGTYDEGLLKDKIEGFIFESKKNIDSKIKSIISYLLLMKEENEKILSKSKKYQISYNYFYNFS